MKILYLITKSNWGGAGRYVFDLATELKNNNEIVVGLGGEGLLKKRLEEENIRVISLTKLGRDVKIIYDFKSFFEILHIIKTEKPDLVHLNSSKIGGIGALACRLMGVKKIIFTAHGWAFNEPRPLWQKILIKNIAYITILLCHKTIAVSENVKNHLVNWPFIKNKIISIHNGIKDIGLKEKNEALKELSHHSPFLEKNIQIFENSFVIGMVGELHKIKGQIYAIKAINILKKEYPNIILLIAGDGEEKKSLKEIIKKLELEKNVFLLGPIYDVSKFLKAFNIFLLTSLSEGLAYVILEAGFAELPVVATNVGGIPEIIKNFETGILIDPKKPLDIKNAIDYVLKNPEKARVFGENLKLRVNSEFTLPKMVQKTFQIYTL